MSHFIQLACPACDWAEVCGPDRVTKWLLDAGRLRRDQQPELEIMHEVLRGISTHLECPQCEHQGLVVTEAEDDAEDWPEAPTCEGCGSPIPAERLAVLPDATRCAGCQQAWERGEVTEELEYCPRCGAPMELRPSQGAGVTRYVMVCTNNPRCR